jgi:hypothetical protein
MQRPGANSIHPMSMRPVSSELGHLKCHRVVTLFSVTRSNDLTGPALEFMEECIWPAMSAGTLTNHWDRRLEQFSYVAVQLAHPLCAGSAGEALAQIHVSMESGTRQ